MHLLERSTTRADGSTQHPRRLPVVVSVCFVVILLGADSPVAPLRPALDVLLAGAVLWAIGPQLGRARIHLLPVLFVLWSAATYAWSLDQFATRRELLYVAPIFLALALAGSVLGPRGAADALVLTVRVVTVLTIVSILVSPAAAFLPAEDGAPGLSGPFAHKNALGYFFAIALVVMVDAVRRTGSGRWFVVASGIAILASQSSTALVIAVGGLVVYAVFLRLFVGTGVARRATSLVVLTGAALVAPLVLLQFVGLVASAIGRDLTFTGRVSIWNAVVDMISRRPLSGHGFGAPWLEVHEFNDPVFRELGFRAYHAHSAYLDALLQIGVIGTGLLLGVVLVATARLAVRSAQGVPGALALFTLLTMALAAGVSETAPLLGTGTAMIGLVWGAAHAGAGVRGEARRTPPRAMRPTPRPNGS